jgi:two-component sensor histidine kinase
MALSELMMNARKHGSLSVGAGRVDLTWTRENGELRIDWKEREGPTVEPPAPGREARAGLILVHGFVEYQLGGRVEIDFSTNGFAATLHVPLSEAASA